MDIADVQGLRMGDDSFGHTMGARDDELVFAKVKELGSKGKKGKVEAVSFF
jgi:hypothetical protein